MIATHNRTFICSVVFIDIVDYTTKSVDQQIKIKARLNRFISEATKNVAFNDRIIIDTGDGAAMCFLGDPEDALFVAMNLRDAIAADVQSDEPLLVRFGINLGPVKLVKDINDRENLIGDGINTAQRIMNFAEAGQLLVSRSYYEVVSCLTREYADLFHYIGMRADKHIRKHEIYGIKQTAQPTDEPIQMGMASLGEGELPILETNLKEGSYTDPSSPIEAPELKKEGLKSISSSALPPPDRSRRPVTLLAYGAVIIALVIAASLYFIKRPSSDLKQASSPPQKIASIQDSQGQTPGKVVLENAQPPQNANESPEIPPMVIPPVQNSHGEAPGKDTSENVQPVKAANSEPEIPPVVNPPAKKPVVQFAVSPWGEVYLNGKNLGASPPLTSLSIEPGKHTIEIKNTSFPTYSQTFEAKLDEKLKITHKFK